ncbi:hypothetical protein RCO28_05850 [Streptomyces sp. LHD-70]|uniref:hypothetical protein n=1 Tax=Streptomyces sp. LHD-70 TaxID=3072140 RepID=UPI00280F2FAB|nr:hypothetical protein [Streptomyces sp. LHD-70]MDQ8702014.1 hypothetical protein [Streptomyces sp. LHD-70]
MRKLSKKLIGALSAALALLVLGGYVVYEEFIDTGMCCVKPTIADMPKGPDGEIDVASQSVTTQVPAGYDFSIHVRPGGGADDWQVAESGEAGGVLRAKGAKTVKGTRYFKFRALRPGKSRIVLKETDGERTMTYPVEAVGGGESTYTEPDPEGVPEEGNAREFERDSRRLDGDFVGTVSLSKGEDYLIANRYSNQPGYTWTLTEDSDDGLTVASPDPRYTTGDPAAARQDWYSLSSLKKGTTTLKLFGCYRCTWDDQPSTPESKKFSVTKTLTVVVH